MNKVSNRVPEAFQRLEQALTEWAHEGTDHIIKKMKESMKMPKSGIFYGSHQASAPGEAPSDHRHGLINSIERDRQFLKGIAFSRNPVAAYMEEGTKDSEGDQIIAPRPMWLATLEAEKPYLGDLLQQKVMEAKQ